MTAAEFVAQVNDLPALPQAGLKLMRLLEDPDVDVDAVVKVVRTDAPLSAKLLRVCNSAAYGARQAITSIDQAVFALGFSEVQRLAIALTFGGVLNRALHSYEIDSEAYWLHSLLVGFGAEALAKSVDRFKAESSAAYTAGLLHDIGKLVLNRALARDSIATIRDLIETHGYSRLDAERDVVGFEHAEAGACLIERWGLPECLVEAVRHHHDPVYHPQPTLSVFTHMANCIAHQFGSAPGWGGCAIRVDERAAASVGFGAEQHQLALMAVFEQIDKAREFTIAA